MGWKAQTPLRQGLEKAYQWYLDNIQGKQNA
jgi:dTDP-D-glucose 4,6-dehydratase